MIILNLIRGFCMALADCVPGVSGGTIAFILGFYDKFVTSLDRLMSGTKEERIEAFKFLIKIGIGWGIGAVLGVLVLTSVFESHIYAVSSLFLGFIVFSIPLIVKEEKEQFMKKYINAIFAVLGIVLVVGIAASTKFITGGGSIALNSLSLGTAIYVFVVAMIAISAMILPGISGSTLLLIFGIYMPVMSAIKAFLTLDFSYFWGLCAFGFGILTGVVLIIKLVKKALEKYRSQMMYFILGLMVGSVYPIILGPTTLENPQPAMTLDTFSILFFVIGGAVIIGLQVVKAILEKKEVQDKVQKFEDEIKEEIVENVNELKEDIKEEVNEIKEEINEVKEKVKNKKKAKKK